MWLSWLKDFFELPTFNSPCLTNVRQVSVGVLWCGKHLKHSSFITMPWLFDSYFCMPGYLQESSSVCALYLLRAWWENCTCIYYFWSRCQLPELGTSRWEASLFGCWGKHSQVWLCHDTCRNSFLSRSSSVLQITNFFKHLECAKAVCSCWHHWAGALEQISVWNTAVLCDGKWEGNALKESPAGWGRLQQNDNWSKMLEIPLGWIWALECFYENWLQTKVPVSC